ncbi:MAG: hypothetical protein QW478_06730, partial [Candidatus Micrarchaeaceae archaeon]
MKTTDLLLGGGIVAAIGIGAYYLYKQTQSVNASSGGGSSVEGSGWVIPVLPTAPTNLGSGQILNAGGIVNPPSGGSTSGSTQYLTNTGNYNPSTGSVVNPYTSGSGVGNYYSGTAQGLNPSVIPGSAQDLQNAIISAGSGNEYSSGLNGYSTLSVPQPSGASNIIVVSNPLNTAAAQAGNLNPLISTSHPTTSNYVSYSSNAVVAAQAGSVVGYTPNPVNPSQAIPTYTT